MNAAITKPKISHTLRRSETGTAFTAFLLKSLDQIYSPRAGPAQLSPHLRAVVAERFHIRYGSSVRQSGNLLPASRRTRSEDHETRGRSRANLQSEGGRSFGFYRHCCAIGQPAIPPRIWKS